MSGFDHRWHVALNQYNRVGGEFRHWMYDAKQLFAEIPRLALLFKAEREGALRKAHQQCSHSAPVPVADNKLTCCMGVVCRECPHLKALDSAEMTGNERDVAKAWTCAGHTMADGEDLDKSEGLILTADDRLFWDRIYANMAQECHEPPKGTP